MDVLARARAGDADAFRELVRPHERELRVHCYRMLGSLADAEDALQDTLLSAWQGLASFEGRASLRTWLYRVATSRCLDALRSARRRPSSSPEDPAMADLVPPPPTRLGEVIWLQPCPDDLLSGLPDTAPGPEARYELTESVSLAFITAVQLLPPRQRAVLILRDVLGFRASEVAGLLETTEESVTSALKRARATLAGREPNAAARSSSSRPPAGSPAELRLVRKLTAAFAAADVPAVVALLTDDAWFTMPPLPFEYRGRDLAGKFLAATAFRPGWVPALVAAGTRANGGQPAFGFYVRNEATGEPHTVGLLVLTLNDRSVGVSGAESGARISAMTRFDASLLARFGLPDVYSTNTP